MILRSARNLLQSTNPTLVALAGIATITFWQSQASNNRLQAHRIVLISDDGSKLFLNDRLFIDHDGNHPATPASRLVRLQAGLLPVKLEYFQGNGDKSLHLVVEPCQDRKNVSLKDMKLAQGERLRRP